MTPPPSFEGLKQAKVQVTLAEPIVPHEQAIEVLEAMADLALREATQARRTTEIAKAA